MHQQSNSANLLALDSRELAAKLGQLRLADCEPHRALLLERVAVAWPDVDPATPTVVLLRALSVLATGTHAGGGSPSGERRQTAPADDLDVAFAS